MTLRLRPWSLADVSKLVPLAGNSRIARFMTNRFRSPFTRETGEAFIRTASQSQPTRLFAVAVDGRVAGGIGLHLRADIHCLNGELGNWLGKPCRGKGRMTRTELQAVVNGFETFSNNRIMTRPFGTNLASQRVLEKAGFVLEARFEKTLFKHEKLTNEPVYAIRRPAGIRATKL